MKINQLIANNINRLETVLPVDESLGIAGLSGSGKTTFCQTIGKNQKNVSFPYCQKLNTSIYSPILWRLISVRSKWKQCHLFFFLVDHPYLQILGQPLAHIQVCLLKSVSLLLNNIISLQRFFHLIMSWVGVLIVRVVELQKCRV